MNNDDAAMPVFISIKGTPQQMREEIANAIEHPHQLSVTFQGSEEAVHGTMTSLHPGQGAQETKVRVTLASGDRIIIYVPCSDESATITAHTFASKIPSNPSS